VIPPRYKWSFKLLQDKSGIEEPVPFYFVWLLRYANRTSNLKTALTRKYRIDVRRNSSKYTLKKFLNRNAFKIPSYYNTGSRRGQVLQCQTYLAVIYLSTDYV
jgi:hypothetical protein